GVTRSGWFRPQRISRWHQPYAAVLVLTDFICAVLASVLAVTKWPQAVAAFVTTERMYLIGMVLLPLGWLVVLWGHGCYDRRYLGLGTDEFKRVVRASLTVVAIVSFLSLTMKADLSRLATSTSLLATLIFLLITRYIARRLLHLLRKQGACVHRVLLVGSLPDALEVSAVVARNPFAGLIPVGVYLTQGRRAARNRQTSLPVYTSRDRDVVTLVRDLGADTIAVCGSAGSNSTDLRRLAWQLEGTGIDLIVAPQLTDIAGPRVHIRPVEGLPLLHVEEPTISGVGWLAKYAMDRLVALIGLIVLAPLLVAVAIVIKVTSPGPVFFRQGRVGREGKKFRVWKFRTMYLDAEKRLAQVIDQNEGDGLLFKIRNDPRITSVGRWLRRTSIDELPQLINVLKGEMSLVGPRPLYAEDGDFLGDVRRRLLVRPGITGLWQVSGRSDLSWDDAVRLDLYYVDNWSLAFDLVILWRTVIAVMRRKGAY
ncbi:MAG TPA: sugar transferase, partial [Micromonosporaceae bacterium]|nr:sugar transferase [Micromonosporaceae bacterium]